MNRAHSAGIEPVSIEGFSVLGLALFLLITFALAWLGVWRSWVGDPRAEFVAMSLMPMMGFLFLPIWLTSVLPDPVGDALDSISLSLAAVFVVTVFWTPWWFGARWYREIKRARRRTRRRS